MFWHFWKSKLAFLPAMSVCNHWLVILFYSFLLCYIIGLISALWESRLFVFHMLVLQFVRGGVDIWQLWRMCGVAVMRLLVLVEPKRYIFCCNTKMSYDLKNELVIVALFNVYLMSAISSLKEHSIDFTQIQFIGYGRSLFSVWKQLYKGLCGCRGRAKSGKLTLMTPQGLILSVFITNRK